MVNLAAIRSRKGLTLARLAEITKISISYLRAIEAGEIEKLPGTIYTVSYLRQYARAIDFGEDELLANFGLAPTQVEAPPDPRNRKTLHRWWNWLLPVVRSFTFKRSP